MAGPISVPCWAQVSPKTRVGGSGDFSADFAWKTSTQVAEPRRENRPCGYDFASGVRKYLYAHNDPVNGVDPSGNFLILDLVLSSAIRAGKFGRYGQYVARGYQAYSRIEDALDIGEAIYWTAAITASLYFDSATHSSDTSDPESFALDAALESHDSGISEGTALSGPAAASFGAPGIFAIFQSAATEGHHIATDKHKLWTPRFERIFDRAKLSMQNAANLVPVKGHGGPHLTSITERSSDD